MILNQDWCVVGIPIFEDISTVVTSFNQAGIAFFAVSDGFELVRVGDWIV